jgi:hypothetical protein
MNTSVLKPPVRLLIGAVACSLAIASGYPQQRLSPLPQGATLPVTLDKGLNAHHVKIGEPITANLTQRVPLPDGTHLPQKAKLIGSVVSYDGRTLGLQFNELKLGNESRPIGVKLLAAALWLDVEETQKPLELSDRSLGNPADWTTMQIGHDEVYRSGWVGTVYDQYSQPVGHADAHGVYAAPNPAGFTRAMGPFSTTSKGLYDLRWLDIVSPGGNGKPIIFGLSSPKWQLHGQTALLLEVSGDQASAAASN